MGACNVKHIFSLEDSLILESIIIDTYHDDKVNNTLDFYKELISKLKSEDTPFIVEYSSDLNLILKDKLSESINQIKKSIVDLIPNEFEDLIKKSELESILEERFQLDLEIQESKDIIEDEEESFNIESVGALEEYNPIEELKFRDYIEQTYGGCVGAINLMKHVFSREIFINTLCNFEKGIIVTNNVLLNTNIALYKNQLLLKVLDLLHDVNPQIDYPSSIYTDTGNVHLGYYKVLSDMRLYLESIKGSNTINEEYSNNLFGNKSKVLNAVHAYTILRYFDSLLQDTLGKTISFDKSYKNLEVTLDSNKYQFSKDSQHQRKSWTDSENRTAIQNSSKFSKFVLESIPLIVNGKDTGKNIGLLLLYMTMTKLFSNVLLLSLKKNKSVLDLVRYIYAFHGSPTFYMYKILNLITSDITVLNALRSMKSPDSNIGISAGFTDNDLGVILSLYKYVFSYDTDMHLKNYNNYQNKSIRSIEYNLLKTSYNIGKYSILNDIVGAIDDGMDASYFYSLYGPEGNLIVLRRVKYKDRRDSEKFKDTVNSANILYDQSYREHLKEGCKVEFLGNTLKAIITIPVNTDENLELSFDIESSSDLGILGLNGKIKILKSNELDKLLERVYTLFSKNSIIDLSSTEQRSRLLSNVNLTNDEQLFVSILNFIDQRLHTMFLTEDGLKKLNFYKTLQLDSGNEKYLDDLLAYSVKSQIVSDIYYDFNSVRLDPNNHKITNKRLLKSFIKTKAYPAFANLNTKDEKTYYITNNGISNLRTIPSSTQWVEVYNLATLILYGENVASVSKNLSDNNDANYVTSFLGGQIFNVLYKARQEEIDRQELLDRALADITEKAFAVATHDPTFESLSEDSKKEYLNRIISGLESLTSIPPQIAASKLLFTHNPGAIKQCVINSDVKNRAGTVKSLRDLKTSELFYNAIIHNFWSSFIKTGEYCILPTTYSDKVKLILYMIDGKNYKINEEKSISELTKDELIELYRSSVGEASKLALENVIYTYELLWGDKLTLQEINRRLKNYTEEQLVKEALSKGLRVLLDLHYRIKKINGKEALLVNENLVHEAKYANPEYLRNKLAQEEVQFINHLINSGILFYVDYHDTSLYDKDFSKLSLRDLLLKSSNPIAKIITSLYTTEAEVNLYANKWIKNGKLILAYDKNGDSILYTNTDSVSEINPLLEKYFYIDSLVSSNLRLSLTGFETNHPDKSKFVKMWDNVAKANKITNPLIASSELITTLQKTNVLITNDKTLLDGIVDLDNLTSAELQEYINGIKVAKKLITNSEELASKFKQFMDVRLYNLSLSDVMALNDSFDLYSMSLSNNPEMLRMADSMSTIIENVAQGTQLKRNVIIPATLHYVHNDLINGVAKKIKVAVIKDMKADVFNFMGDKEKTDSMDGSAYTTAEQSILENMSLGSLEVGPDKKPIWHHYDLSTGTSSLMKFASYEINNERMLLSMNSKVPLIRMYKKMTNLLWAKLDENGVPIKWNTSEPIELGKGVTFGGINISDKNLNFYKDILDNNPLYYRDYDSDGSIVYKLIVGFGGNSIDGYYTIESYVDKWGDIDLTRPLNEQVYHWFNANSEHHINKLNGDHTINSLYELWLSLGGLYSLSIGKDEVMVDSETSHLAVVGFMNKTIKAKPNADRFDISLNSYNLPLKDMMIGYLTNNSAMKNGAANRNNETRWFDEEPLAYMEMDSDGLGIQMDADHDVEEAATMTEFSQVIAALEAGGFLHKYAKLVYSDLGRVAAKASKMEMDAVINFLAGEKDNYDDVKNQLYDVLGRTLFNGIKSRDDSASLTDTVLRAIEKRFNKNFSHKNDVFKIPFSDTNIYSLILPTLVSIINKKSIKRQFTGSGFVITPGYNVIQYFDIGGNLYIFNDLVKIAFNDIRINKGAILVPEDKTLLEKTVVLNYLNKRQLDPSLYTIGVDEYIPTDVVDIMSGEETLATISLDELETYYKFKDRDWNYFGIDGTKITGFRYNIRLAKNLAPVKITFETETGRKMNVFDLPLFREAYKNPNSLNRKAVDELFLNLDKGFYIDENGHRINIRNLSKSAAELVCSNMYKSKFGIGDKSVAEIRELGVDAFKIKYKTPIKSRYYDLIFTKNNGEDIYISFESPKKSLENTYESYDNSKLITERDDKGNIDVFLISDDNRKLFKVGRYILKSGYTYRSRFTNATGQEVSELEALRDGYTHSLGSFFDSLGNPTNSKEALKENYSYEPPAFYNDKGERVRSKNAKNLKADNSTVYEYIEFVSKYKVTERFNEGDEVYHMQEYEKYYINTYNIRLAMNITDNSNKSKKLIKREKEELRTFVANILDNIYATLQFSGILVNSKLNRNSAISIVRYVSKMNNIDLDFKLEVLDGMLLELSIAIKESTETISIDNKLKDSYNKYYDKLALEKYSSWELSLYFTSARIPALTLQSFMLMKAIAYSGNSRNVAYVSHWQTWLQGSDYKCILDMKLLLKA